jgi:hypothetical protein
MHSREVADKLISKLDSVKDVRTSNSGQIYIVAQLKHKVHYTIVGGYVSTTSDCFDNLHPI